MKCLLNKKGFNNVATRNRFKERNCRLPYDKKLLDYDSPRCNEICIILRADLCSNFVQFAATLG
ncbi:CLUMA_CG002435, isoform A [Clunio marinus]|uniref:CLUMA_CG002435, isoform A n=1 Tax=Clunio marinus TaxID=568069 RepID=A0A1J1HQ82_9DIPT|nr:CLUMA_CG002435, isoform A [Clunio marinus]